MTPEVEALDAALREACIPNMRRALAGEPITDDDIASEQAGLDAIAERFGRGAGREA